METESIPVDVVDRHKPPQPVQEFHACTSCRQRSYYFVTINGTELPFCGHHATQYEVNLLAKADKPPRDLRYLISP